MTLAKNLKSVLDEKSITMTELARRSGIAKSNISSWLAGSNPRIDQLSKVADFLGVSIDYLVNGKKEKTTPIDDILSKFEIHSGLYELTIKKVIKK